MSLDSVDYSIIQNTHDSTPQKVLDEEVPDLIAKLLTHRVVLEKEFAGLFSGCTFEHGRRKKDANYVHFITLDYDNSAPTPKKLAGTGVPCEPPSKVRIDNPVTPELVVMMLNRMLKIRSVVDMIAV